MVPITHHCSSSSSEWHSDRMRRRVSLTSKLSVWYLVDEIMDLCLLIHRLQEHPKGCFASDWNKIGRDWWTQEEDDPFTFQKVPTLWALSFLACLAWFTDLHSNGDTGRTAGDTYVCMEETALAFHFEDLLSAKPILGSCCCLGEPHLSLILACYL